MLQLMELRVGGQSWLTEGLGFNLCVVPSHLDCVLNFREVKRLEVRI